MIDNKYTHDYKDRHIERARSENHQATEEEFEAFIQGVGAVHITAPNLRPKLHAAAKDLYQDAITECDFLLIQAECMSNDGWCYFVDTYGCEPVPSLYYVLGIFRVMAQAKDYPEFKLDEITLFDKNSVCCV